MPAALTAIERAVSELSHAAAAGDPGDRAQVVNERPELRDAEIACYREEDVSEWESAR